MKFSLVLYPLRQWRSLDEAFEAARLAERLGFASVGFSEHLALPTDPASGALLHPAESLHDPVVLAAGLARETTDLRLRLSALLIPYRHPLAAARTLATLDHLSGGRVTVTVGTGWMRQEFDWLNLPFAERGAITDDYLRAMLALWTQARPDYRGRYVTLTDMVFEPKCLQKPHIPLMIGGAGKRALERVLELGDGWAPMHGSPDELAPSIAWLRREAQARGRTRPIDLFTRIDVMGGNAAVSASRGRHTHLDGAGGAGIDELRATVRAYRELGFDELGLSFPWRDAAEYADRLRWWASEVVPSLD